MDGDHSNKNVRAPIQAFVITGIMGLLTVLPLVWWLLSVCANWLAGVLGSDVSRDSFDYRFARLAWDAFAGVWSFSQASASPAFYCLIFPGSFVLIFFFVAFLRALRR